MSINLKTFRFVTNGFARQNHFNVGFPDWRGLGLTGGIASKLVGIAATPIINSFASSMELPTKSITDTPIRVQYGVPPIRVATDVVYGDWTVTFYSDEMLLLRYFFLEWMELINNTKNHSFSIPKKYKCDYAYGAVLTPQDIPVQVFTFKGLFPKNIGAVQMSQENAGILTFTVTFAYDFFKVNEPIGFAMALGFELLGNTILNKIGSGSDAFYKRTLNAPMGVSVKLPF
jgi:hypothetical protein